MGTETRSATQTLTSQGNELSKMYVALDAQDRPIAVYTAPTSAIQGSRCSLVEYEYFSPTSTIVVRMRETEATWQSAFDYGEVYPAP